MAKYALKALKKADIYLNVTQICKTKVLLSDAFAIFKLHNSRFV